MIKFGTFTVGDRLVVFDVWPERRAGRPRWIASLSATPQVCFAGPDPASAVAELRRFVEQLARHNALFAA